MRLVVGTVACLGLAALTGGCAAGPAPPQTFPAASAPGTAAATPADQTSPAAAQTSREPEVSMQERHFLSEGYKPEMANGEKIFCRRETVLGSRLTAQKMCGTVESLTAAEAETKKDVEQAQRQQTNPTYK